MGAGLLQVCGGEVWVSVKVAAVTYAILWNYWSNGTLKVARVHEALTFAQGSLFDMDYFNQKTQLLDAAVGGLPEADRVTYLVSGFNSSAFIRLVKPVKYDDVRAIVLDNIEALCKESVNIMHNKGHSSNVKCLAQSYKLHPHLRSGDRTYSGCHTGCGNGCSGYRGGYHGNYGYRGRGSASGEAVMVTTTLTATRFSILLMNLLMSMIRHQCFSSSMIMVNMCPIMGLMIYPLVFSIKSLFIFCMIYPSQKV